jgi:co-chaperonin GroES (HSP10)
MRPIGKYIIVEDTKDDVKTKSGLILSGDDIDKFRYRSGKVIASGTDVIAINPGDRIYYDKSMSFKMLIEEEQRTIIRESDVVVVV